MPNRYLGRFGRIQPGLERAPQLCLVIGGAFRNGILNGGERRLDLRELGSARRTIGQVPLGIASLAIEMQNEFLFGQMAAHRVPLCTVLAVINGSSSVRIFLTALKIVFFTASSRTFRTLPISEMECPSKCRRTKAVRSTSVRRCIASLTRLRSSALSSIRSGPGCGAA